MTPPNLATQPPLPAPPFDSTRLWNLAAATCLVLLSGWTLAVDLTHEGHFLFQSAFSSLVLGLFLCAWIIGACSSRVFPKRYVIAGCVLGTLRIAVGWPLVLWMSIEYAYLVLDVALVLLSCCYFFTSKSISAAHTSALKLWQHVVAMTAVAMALSVFFTVTSFFGYAHAFSGLTSGYMRIDAQGINLTERVFEKEGHRIHLIATVHVADAGFYDSLNQRFAQPLQGRRLVLNEGVSDKTHILPKSFTSGATYRKMAEKLGLTEQAASLATPVSRPDYIASWAARGVDFESADIDVGELVPRHQTQLVALLGSMENFSAANLFTLPGGMTALDVEDLLVEGLLKRRNDKLMEHFTTRHTAYAEVFIPWGAAHMPDLNARFLSLGYRQVEEIQRPSIDFWKRFRAQPSVPAAVLR